VQRAVQLVPVVLVDEVTQLPALEIAWRPRGLALRGRGPGDLAAVVQHDREVGGAVHEGAEEGLGAQDLTGQPGPVAGPHQGARERQDHQPRDGGRLERHERTPQGQSPEQQEQYAETEAVTDHDAGQRHRGGGPVGAGAGARVRGQ
jgi:hypothetical protein